MEYVGRQENKKNLFPIVSLMSGDHPKKNQHVKSTCFKIKKNLRLDLILY